MKKNVAIITLILSILLFSIFSIDRITAENPGDAANIIIGISSVDSNSCSECMIDGEFFESGCKRCIQDSVSFRIKTAQNQPIISNWSNNNGMLYGDDKCSGQEIMSDISVNDNQIFWIQMHKKNSEYKLSLFEEESFTNKISNVSNSMCSEPENLKFLRVSMNDGKPIANGGKIVGSIDNIKIYDLTKNERNSDENKTFQNLNLVYSENFSNCETKSCNNTWVLQDPEVFFIDVNKENFVFDSQVTGSNDYAHFEFDDYISSDEWLMSLQLQIDKIDEHPHGKGIFKIDPSYRFLIIGFSIPLFIFSLILLKIKK